MKVRKPAFHEIEITNNWESWTKEISTFSWFYDEKETCYILEGEAEVSDSDGNKIKFGSGDWVEFEKGLECKWKITKGIKKKYLFG